MPKKSTTPNIDSDAIDPDFLEAWAHQDDEPDEIIEEIAEEKSVVFSGRSPNGKLLRG